MHRPPSRECDRGARGSPEPAGARRSLCSLVRVVNARPGSKLVRFAFRTRVVQEIAAANLGAGEVLEQPWTSQRRMNLDVEVKAAVRPSRSDERRVGTP